jgi:hypothetical protein
MEKIMQLVPVGGVDDGHPEAFYGLDLNGNIWYGEVIPGAPMAIRWGRVDEHHECFPITPGRQIGRAERSTRW